MQQLDTYYISVLLINLLIGIALITSIKFISAILCNVSSNDELANKDNPAFGISIAGVALAVTIMITGAISGDASSTLLNETIFVTSYGVLGIVLMIVAKLIFDKISMPAFSMRDEIIKGNIAASILDAGNVVATAIVIRAIMIWVEGDTFSGIVIVVVGFLFSQLILSLLSLYRLKIFELKNKFSIQTAIQENNIALAWRFIGFRIGIALAITATSGLVPYSQDFIMMGLYWLIASFALAIIVSVLAGLADKIILKGIDVNDEVNNQGNIAIGIIQCVTSMSVGIIIATLAS